MHTCTFMDTATCTDALSAAVLVSTLHAVSVMGIIPMPSSIITWTLKIRQLLLLHEAAWMKVTSLCRL
jgi:hypothetical protein